MRNLKKTLKFTGVVELGEGPFRSENLREEGHLARE